jgi:hypothetical protein
MESDTLGDDARVTPATQGPRYGDREAASDAVSGEAHGSGCHGSLGVAAERAEVDLPVSGLKPDWPPSAATAGIAPAALSAGSCRCSTGRGNGRSRRTPDLLQARRRTWVRTNQNGPANRGFSLERPTIGPGRVRSQSDPTQTHKPTAHAKKACKSSPFSKRLKGFEPSTFCMASRTCVSRSAPKFPANARVLGYGCRRAIPRLSTRVHGVLGTQRAPELAWPPLLASRPRPPDYCRDLPLIRGSWVPQMVPVVQRVSTWTRTTRLGSL